MIVHPEFVFVANPKTGSTAMSQALLQVPDASVIGHGASKNHSPADPDETRRVLVMVRNPWDRAVSRYHMLITGSTYFWEREYHSNRMPFSKWVVENHQRVRDSDIRQEYWYDHPKAEVRRYEDGLQQAVESWGFPDVVVPRIRSGGSKPRTEHYSRWYCDETREHVARVCKDTIERFGYTFEEG